MTSRNRTVDEKVGDWKRAFDAMLDEATDPRLSAVIDNLAAIPAPKEEDGLAGFDAYVTAINSSLSIVRVVRADRRTAMIAAAMLTQSGGVSRPILDVMEE